MSKLLIIMMALASGFCKCQSFKKCDVYQYAGTDSSTAQITLKQTFNSSGQIVSETFKGYKERHGLKRFDGSYLYFYRDTMLIKRTFIDENKDINKMLCYYSEQNKLIKQEYFTYERRLRKNIYKNGLRCIITEKDYKKRRTWKQTSEIIYKYNSDGHRILYDATKLHDSSQNIFIWVYDSLGRVSTHSSLKDTRLIWIEEFSYFIEGYKVTRTWYDDTGNPKHLKTRIGEYTPQYTRTFYFDSQNRVIKKVTSTEKGEIVSTEWTDYNLNGQVARTIYQNDMGRPEITHIYVYY